jgi:phytanoyl-CoA hydroxylase
MPAEPGPLGAQTLTEAELAGALAALARDGYARLGLRVPEPALVALRDRVDSLLTQPEPLPGLFYQLDAASGRYEDLESGRGWEGPSLRYRKVEKLERDPLFRAWITHPLCVQLARAVYPDAGRITLYRAILMNKPADGGTPLPWHQDGGRFWGVDRDPTLQVWLALDDAPRGGGCLEVLPGSHLQGLATPLGGLVPAPQVDDAQAEARAVALPARAGEVILLHNHVWHRSGRSATGHPRRALSACYLHGDTRCQRKKAKPREFFEVWAG